MHPYNIFTMSLEEEETCVDTPSVRDIYKLLLFFRRLPWYFKGEKLFQKHRLSRCSVEADPITYSNTHLYIQSAVKTHTYTWRHTRHIQTIKPLECFIKINNHVDHDAPFVFTTKELNNACNGALLIPLFSFGIFNTHLDIRAKQTFVLFFFLQPKRYCAVVWSCILTLN